MAKGMTSEHLAKEADRLLADDVLQHALDNMRQEALESLARADPADSIMITRLQAGVASVDEFRSELERYILAIPEEEERPV
jgi:hypothetical protein